MAGGEELTLDPARPWCRRDGEGWVLSIRVQPSASVTRITGEHGDQLRIRLAAPPVDGKANDELVRFLAKTLGLPRSAVSIVRGQSGRAKSVRVVP